MDKKHWETVYETKAVDSVSWFQTHASMSLALIRRIAPSFDSAIIDVGGGASVLVDELLAAGYRDLTVLDIADAALSPTKARLGPAAASVEWIEGDVRSARLPEARYAAWHDRAVFHFLTDASDREAYLRQVRHAVRPGGHVIVATFAEDGPTRCSGLPVVRYSSEALHAEFGKAFELVATERELHTTPSGVRQSFVYCVFRFSGEQVG